MNNMIIVSFALGVFLVVSGVIIDSREKGPASGAGVIFIGPGLMLMALGILIFLFKAFRVVWLD